MVTNSTLSGNHAAYGGGIHNVSGTLNLYNTIIANSPNGGECYNASGTVTGSHNLIEDAANTCGFTNGVNGNNIGIDPILDPPTGSLAYFPLRPSSPAIDAGNIAICANAPVNNESQNGVYRSIGGACDIGSVEMPLYALLDEWTFS